MSSYRIIGIHGLNNKPAPQQLQDWWIASITEGLERNLGRRVEAIDFELVYWADLLYETPLTSDPEPYVPAEGSGSLRRYQLSWFNRIKNFSYEMLGGLADRFSMILGLTAVADEVLERTAPDLDTYYDNPEKRSRIQQNLIDAIASACQNDQRILLVAHSMGSIVAFDILSTIAQTMPGCRIHDFVTLGSPLGLHQIKRKLRKSACPLQVPEVVTRWTNYADRNDLIAADTQLSSDFAENQQGVSVNDWFVHNSYTSPTGRANHHKIYGYLRTPEFSELVEQFIGK